MPSLLFYLFSFLAVAGAVALVALRNPVGSALSMVMSFVGLAALFIGLNAYFVGIVQILVYAGAIMVLFLFIIMLLDLKKEEGRRFDAKMIAAGLIIPILLVVQVYAVLDSVGDGKFAALDLPTAAHHQEGKVKADLEAGELPDTALIGHTLFGSEPGQGYNFPIQIIGVLLLVSTVGVVVLSSRPQASTQLKEPKS